MYKKNQVRETRGPEILLVKQLLCCYDVYLDVCENALVALHLCFELAELLDFRNGDVLLVNLNTCGCESLGNLSCGNGAIELAGLTDLGSDLDLYSLDLCCDSLSVCNELGLFVSSLAESLLVLLECRWGSYGSETLRNEIIASVTGLYFYHITGLAEIGNFFLKNDLHNASII